MHTNKPTTVQLSEADARMVQQYADQNGLTLEQACTQLTQQGIQARFVRAKAPARVLHFTPRAK
ncbi:hypothetical protein CBY09_08155 [Acidovorax kalamii]|uniref:Uncharacterized protein n=1 Tax=Acidovorax kalamii TaxID=2004485 RepID=A0A235ENS8_9BURK|nr:hypothetical protein CBY09_08155 [Acidovorax kalamii]